MEQVPVPPREKGGFHFILTERTFNPGFFCCMCETKRLKSDQTSRTHDLSSIQVIQFNNLPHIFHDASGTRAAVLRSFTILPTVVNWEPRPKGKTYIRGTILEWNTFSFIHIPDVPLQYISFIFLFWVDHRRICTSFGVSECPTWRIISHSYIVFSTTLNRSANFLSSPREERWSEVRVMIPVHLTGHPTDIACLWCWIGWSEKEKERQGTDKSFCHCSYERRPATELHTRRGRRRLTKFNTDVGTDFANAESIDGWFERE